jgi:hypothetical protein
MIFISGKEIKLPFRIPCSLRTKPESILLSYFKELYDQGELSVMNVGYPNPDKSHFRSMDIWHSASRSDEYLETGWLGRFSMKNVTNAIILLRLWKWMIC